MTTDGWHAVNGKHCWQERLFSLTEINWLCILTWPYTLIVVLSMYDHSLPRNAGKRRIAEIALMRSGQRTTAKLLF